MSDNAPVRYRQCVIVVCVLLLGCLATGQEQGFSAGPGTFTCQGGASFPPVEDQYRGAALSALQGPPKDLPNTKPRVFGPFDGRTIEFYQFLTGKSEGIATETELHVYLRVHAASGNRWYELQARDPGTMKADPPGAEDNGEQPPDDTTPKKEPSTDAVEISAPDAAVPLFQLSYTSRWLGANAGGNFGHVLLLDLRGSVPTIAKHLECVTGEGGGVCTAPDSGYGSKSSVSCTWKGLDYVCDERIDTSTGWGERFSQSSYLLMSGKDAYAMPADAVSLEGIGDKLMRHKAEGQKFLVPDVGEVTAIYSVIQGEHDLYLLAARGTGSTPQLAFAGGSNLDARFFLTERPYSDRPAVAVELKPATATALAPISYADAELQRQQATKAAPPPVSSREGGAPLSYNVKKLYGDDEFFILQVTVKEGNGHVVYWVGVDQRASPIVADLYRVSSDASPYYHCMMFIQEEGAAAYRVLPGASFRAALEIEPMHITDEEGNFDPNPEGENQAPGKVCTKRIAWDRSKGFVFAENPVCRTAAARAIIISDSGAITSKRMPVAPAN